MNTSAHFIGFQTIVHKEIKRMLRVWKQAILPPIITTTLYFIIFGQFIGSRVGEVQGIDYMQFIVPGLVMMPVITGAFMHVAFSVYFARFTHAIDDILVAPIPNHWLIAAYLVGGMIRGLVIGLLVLIISLLFAPFQVAHPIILLTYMLLTAFVFSVAGFIMGIFARNFEDASTIPTFVLTPLTYLGGIFYSIKQLPPFWQTISKANPILYMINGLRYGSLGITDVNIWVGIAILVIMAATLSIAAMYLLKKGVGLKT